MDHDRSIPNEIPATVEEDDPLVEESLRDALGPYLGALSPEERADYRQFLTVFMKSHPAAAPLYQRLRKRPSDVEVSGDVPREGAEDGLAPDPAIGDAAPGSNVEPLTPRGDGTFGGGRR